MSRPPLVLATRNEHKLAEVRRLLEPAGIAVDALPDGVELPPEDGDSFEANALPKARAAAAALRCAAIADDSGIESEALGGAPGIRSARYAGPDATDEQNLLKLMTEAPAGSRLRYVCALAYVDPGAVGPGPTDLGAIGPGTVEPGAGAPAEHVFFGECRGRLAADRRGSRGFGYDPAFLPDEAPADTTMAELSDAAKDAISHRGRAVRAFATWFAGRS
jgi:XTP/dITP diphosphohydrolase